jgi:hypothetical protein
MASLESEQLALRLENDKLHAHLIQLRHFVLEKLGQLSNTAIQAPQMQPPQAKVESQNPRSITLISPSPLEEEGEGQEAQEHEEGTLEPSFNMEDLKFLDVLGADSHAQAVGPLTNLELEPVPLGIAVT